MVHTIRITVTACNPSTPRAWLRPARHSTVAASRRVGRAPRRGSHRLVQERLVQGRSDVLEDETCVLGRVARLGFGRPDHRDERQRAHARPRTPVPGRATVGWRRRTRRPHRRTGLRGSPRSPLPRAPPFGQRDQAGPPARRAPLARPPRPRASPLRARPSRRPWNPARRPVDTTAARTRVLRSRRLGRARPRPAPRRPSTASAPRSGPRPCRRWPAARHRRPRREAPGSRRDAGERPRGFR